MISGAFINAHGMQGRLGGGSPLRRGVSASQRSCGVIARPLHALRTSETQARALATPNASTRSEHSDASPSPVSSHTTRTHLLGPDLDILRVFFALTQQKGEPQAQNATARTTSTASTSEATAAASFSFNNDQDETDTWARSEGVCACDASVRSGRGASLGAQEKTSGRPAPCF